jgi:calcineurin-like phosphoesterase family protein
MPIFFTADTHFGHSNIIEYDSRPFSNADEMDEALIKNWNRAVGPGDSVYHLGDVSLARPERTKEILDSLNGKIYLIRGNHEASAEHKLCFDRFEWIKDYFLLKVSGYPPIALMHYCMRIWDRKHHGAWHLFGHSHSRLPEIEGEYAINVGVDLFDFSPVALVQIRELMEKRKVKFEKDASKES